MSTRTLMRSPSSSATREGAARAGAQRLAHGLGGVLAHGVDVTAHDRLAVRADDALQLGRAPGVGGHLRLEVGDVLRHVAGRVARRR